MQQWEYKVVDFKPSSQVSLAVLNGLGEDGWQLCHIDNGVFVFSRSLQTNDEAEWITRIRDYCKKEGILPTTLIPAYEEMKKATS